MLLLLSIALVCHVPWLIFFPGPLSLSLSLSGCGLVCICSSGGSILMLSLKRLFVSRSFWPERCARPIGSGPPIRGLHFSNPEHTNDGATTTTTTCCRSSNQGLPFSSTRRGSKVQCCMESGAEIAMEHDTRSLIGRQSIGIQSGASFGSSLSFRNIDVTLWRHRGPKVQLGASLTKGQVQSIESGAEIADWSRVNRYPIRSLNISPLWRHRGPKVQLEACLTEGPWRVRRNRWLVASRSVSNQELGFCCRTRTQVQSRRSAA